MKCHRSVWIAVCVGAGILTSSAVGAAQDSHHSSTPRHSSVDDSYGFIFDDDPLSAGGLGAPGPLVVGMSHALRVTLIRPRTEFIAAMLKTVEKL